MLFPRIYEDGKIITYDNFNLYLKSFFSFFSCCVVLWWILLLLLFTCCKNMKIRNSLQYFTSFPSLFFRLLLVVLLYDVFVVVVVWFMCFKGGCIVRSVLSLLWLQRHCAGGVFVTALFFIFTSFLLCVSRLWCSVMYIVLVLFMCFKMSLSYLQRRCVVLGVLSCAFLSSFPIFSCVFLVELWWVFFLCYSCFKTCCIAWSVFVRRIYRGVVLAAVFSYAVSCLPSVCCGFASSSVLRLCLILRCVASALFHYLCCFRCCMCVCCVPLFAWGTHAHTHTHTSTQRNMNNN